MMDFSDEEEEDIHQCGRCKEVFHSIEDYFEHKKAKQCKKAKDGCSSSLRPASALSRASALPSSEPEACQPLGEEISSGAVTSGDGSSHVNRSDESPVQTEKATARARTHGLKSRATKRGRPRKTKQGRLVRKGETANRPTRSRERQVRGAGTPINLRNRDKIFPKKKWVDAFEETSMGTSENAVDGEDPTTDSDGDDEPRVKRRRRGRPPKSTTYSHIMKPAKPYPRQKSFLCPECHHVANRKDEYDRHLRVFHGLSTYICPNCHLPFGDKYKLRRHQEKKVCSRDVDPDVPTPKFMQFKSTNRIYRHALVDDRTKGNGGVKSAPGGRTTAKPSGADPAASSDEQTNCAEINEFSCLECDEFFSCYDAIMEHVRDRHPTILPGICRFCGKWFSSKYRLWRHLTSSVHDHVSAERLDDVKQEISKLTVRWKAFNKQKHERCRKYSCVKCRKTFNARSLYLHHMKRVHNPADVCQRHICNWCGVAMTCSQTVFESHLQAEHGVTARDSYCTCTVCNKVFNQRSHVTRHREALHTPSAQVPSDQLPRWDDHEQETAPPTDRGTKSQRGDVPGLNDSGVESTKVYTCLVCCQHYETRKAHREHLELHRVWVPDPDKDGPFPKDLFTSATFRSLTLSSEPSADVLRRENSQPQQATTSDVTDISQNACDVSLDTMEQDGINILDDEQTETSRVLKMIMQLDSGACDPAVSGDRLTRAGSESKQLETTGHYDWNATSTPPESTGDLLPGASSGKEDVSCPFCRTSFASLEERYQHVVSYHRLTARFKCVLGSCAQIFASADDYLAHGEVHSQRAFICNICNEHLANMSLLLAHKAAIHRNTFPNDNKCAVCKATFPDRKELEHHIILSEFVHFPCGACSRVLRSEAELAEHRALHSEVKSFLCEQCGASFTNNVALQRHRANHGNARPHKCTECEASFNKREHLLRHVISKHSDLKPFTCQTCGKSFKRRDKLSEHQRIHGSDKPFACSLCGLRYRYREGLRYHEKTHERQKKYACSLCPVHYPRPGQLKRHLLERHNVRSREQHMYPCSLCSVTFSRPERVRRHIERVHKSPVQWQAVCQVCDKGFPGERSLNTHMAQVHSGSDFADGALGSSSSSSKQEAKATSGAAAVQAIKDSPEPLSVGVPKVLASDCQIQSLYDDRQDQAPQQGLVSDDAACQPNADVAQMAAKQGTLQVAENPLADPSASGGSGAIVSKASMSGADSAEPVTVFMYLHPPVEPTGHAVRQHVIAQSEAAVDGLPIQNCGQTGGLAVNLPDVADVQNSSAGSYLPTYDQIASLALPTANQIQYNVVSEVDAYGATPQYAMLSQSGHHDNGQQPIDAKQDAGGQLLDAQSQVHQAGPSSSNYPAQSPTSQTLEPPLNLSQLSYRYNVASQQDNSSASQQLFQLISLDAIQAAVSSAGVMTPGNVSVPPVSCQTLNSIQNVQGLPKACPIQTTLSGHVQPSPLLLTSATQPANHQMQSLVHISQANAVDNMHQILQSQQHQVQPSLQQQQQQQHQQQQQQQLHIIQQESLLQHLPTNSHLAGISQSYSLQQATDMTNAIFTPLLQSMSSTGNS